MGTRFVAVAGEPQNACRLACGAVATGQGSSVCTRAGGLGPPVTSDPEQACTSRAHPQREAWVFPPRKEGLVRVPTGLPSRSPHRSI